MPRIARALAGLVALGLVVLLLTAAARRQRDRFHYSTGMSNALLRGLL
jgi:hypothetical protein